MSTERIVSEINAALAEHRDDQQRQPMETYMKNHFPFYGIKTPERKKILAPFVNDSKTFREKERFEVAFQLFQMPERECHYAALAVLEKGKKAVSPEAVEFYRELLLTKPWWDTVDMIASHLCGEYFKLYPQQLRPYTEQFRDSDFMWLRRAALLFQLKYKGETDQALLFETILCLKDEKEFFIEKAIGWALREYSKTDHDAVIDFLSTHECRPLSRREGLKWLKNKQPHLLDRL
ncbi:DNA alkylation repair protein [Halobacillus kuroshimensis]|uniref:DNA alkylation repair protein n=1 Tax=Halobacillus kuroshimensis TaxID=302481 RepID=UPI00041DCF1E|nr:DNA alkylation repair protein [Halobacillus kuroshimensis]